MIAQMLLRLVGFLVAVAGFALAAGLYVSPWMVHVTLIGVLVYLAGALMSAWTFLGYPASIGGGFR